MCEIGRIGKKAGKGFYDWVADGNIGSIFGWGFAPFQGGALQFVNAVGPKKFVERARELAKKYGTRFEPAGVVVRMAGEGKGFAD